MAFKLVSLFGRALRFVRPRRRWLRFSLSTLLISFTACGVWLGIATNRNRARQATFAAIERGGGVVLFAMVDDNGQTVGVPDVPKPDLWEFITGRAYANVLEVSLGGSVLTDEEFAEIAKLDDLQSFQVGGSDLTDERLLALSGLTKIKKIDLQNTLVTDAGLAALQDMPDLEEVKLAGTRIKGPGLVHLADKTSISVLLLHDTQLGDDGPGHLVRLDKLSSLVLNNTRISDVGLSRLAEANQLRELGLKGTRVTDAGMAHLGAFTKLRFLDLSETQIDGSGLASLTELPALHSLWLSDTHVNDQAIKDLAVLPQASYIDLSKTEIGDEGGAWLARFPKLMILYIDESNIGDLGAAALANAPQLVELRLNRTQVGDAGFVALSTSRSLQHLTLNGTLVSDAGLDAASARRARLQFWGARVTRAGIDRFLKRLGGPPIDWQELPKGARLALAADLEAFAQIKDSDSAESLWERAVMLSLASHPSGDAGRPMLPRDKVDALFLAAVERSERPAPIFVAWGDCRWPTTTTGGLNALIEKRLAGHSHEALLTKWSRSGSHKMRCYAAAAACDPAYATAWARLTSNTPDKKDSRRFLDVLVECEPDNAMSHYWRVILQWRVATAEELESWLEAGHSAPRIEGHPSPLPSHVFKKAPHQALETSAGVLAPADNLRSDDFWYFFAHVSNAGRDGRPMHNPRLAKSLAKMVDRVWDAAMTEGASSFDSLNIPNIFLLSEEAMTARGMNAAIIAKTNNVRLRWQSAISPWYAKRPKTAFLRLGSFFTDVKAAERRVAESYADALKTQEFDGSLEWLTEIETTQE